MSAIQYSRNRIGRDKKKTRVTSPIEHKIWRFLFLFIDSFSTNRTAALPCCITIMDDLIVASAANAAYYFHGVLPHPFAYRFNNDFLSQKLEWRIDGKFLKTRRAPSHHVPSRIIYRKIFGYIVVTLFFKIHFDTSFPMITSAQT